MSLRSIYQKTCPSCATLVAQDATECDCGYAFGTQTASPAEAQPDEQTTQEQELMREYLNARIAQAIDDLKSMQSVLDADPKNLEKAGRLMKSYAALRELRNELDALPGAQPSHSAEPASFTGEPSSTSTPGEAFRAAQANKAEQVMKAAGMTTKDCPRCRAVLPERSALCFCGFAFTHDDTRATDSAESQPGEENRATP